MFEFHREKNTFQNERHVTCFKAVKVKKNVEQISVALVRERTIPTETPPLVGEVNANFYG
jgi:hypothetical protein